MEGRFWNEPVAVTRPSPHQGQEGKSLIQALATWRRAWPNPRLQRLLRQETRAVKRSVSSRARLCWEAQQDTALPLSSLCSARGLHTFSFESHNP